MTPPTKRPDSFVFLVREPGHLSQNLQASQFVNLGLPASPNSNLMEFLNQHADTLKHFSLQHIPLGSQSLGVPDPLPLPVLPHLETLEFKHASSFQNIREVTSSEGLDAVRPSPSILEVL